MKKILYFALFTLLCQPAMLMAQSHTKKYETFAIVGVMIALAFFVGGFYYYLVNKKAKKNTGDKYVIKTVEAYKNGRKVIMTKKYRVVEEKEFPNELKRSTRR